MSFRARLSSLAICAFALATLPSTSLAAQQPGTGVTVTASASARFSEVRVFEQYVGYWTTEPGWSTELQLRNNIEAGELTVTPAARTADGAETALPPVTIKSGDVVSLDLSEVFLKAAPKLIGAYGSLVLRYSALAHRVLYAAVMVRMEGRPIAFHLDANFHSGSLSNSSREGIWWLPRDSVADFLILTNASNQKLVPTLTLYDSGGSTWHKRLSLAPRQTQRFSVRTLLQQAGLKGSYGGIRVESTTGTAGFLDSAHLLFDEQGGFSANMKMFNRDLDTPLSSRSFGGVKEWTVRAPMLALSDPDPALGFPAGTTFATQSVRSQRLHQVLHRPPSL